MSRSCSSFTLVVTALMLIVLCGCGTASSTAELKRGKQQPEQARAPSGAMGNDNPGIDLHCVADRIRNASAPFHWSYKKEVIGVSASDWEANVAPNAITGTFIDSSGTHAIRGLRSRSTSWDSAVMMLTGPLPASTFALVNNSAAMVRNGIEKVNGQSAIKYTIDTTQATGGEADLIKSVLGASGSIKGSAWVTPHGCPVKFVLDVEQHNTGGAVEREHHEANVTKP